MRRFFAILSLLVAAWFSVRLGAVPAARSPSGPTSTVPTTLGDWQGFDEPVSERTLALLGEGDVLVRRYFGGSREVVLAVAVSRANRRVAHPPEVCLRAAGYEIVDRGVVAVDGLPEGAVHLATVRQGVEEQVLYWYVVGDRSTVSYLGHQIGSALERLRGKDARTALIRLSARGAPGSALPDLHEFAALVTRLPDFP